MAIGSCATQHCPRCGYTMPDESKSAAARLVRLLFRSRRPSPSAGATLADAAAGTDVRVARLEGPADLQARLTAQGIAPGVRLHVLQRLPTFVIEVGETTLGLEREVAERVVLEP
jgi:Fe2+ transport system protein FeoA